MHLSFPMWKSEKIKVLPHRIFVRAKRIPICQVLKKYLARVSTQ